MQRLGIIVNTRSASAETALNRVTAWAHRHGWPIACCEKIEPVRRTDFPSMPRDKFVGHVDMLLTLGGDGTMLQAARCVAGSGIPILGINLGTLGFLTVVSPNDIDSALDRVARGDCIVEDRLMLQVKDGGGAGETWWSLNDVVVDKGGIARIITMHVHLNGEFLSEIAGDGLIVATPTGSTAYALSVGGPILLPTMQGFLLAPISPHTLAQRPMVFGAGDSLRVTVTAVAGPAMLTVDGQLARSLNEGASIEIARSPNPARLINFPERSFLRVLREKLHWGLAPGEGSH
jgi:NAD+ kinase